MKKSTKIKWSSWAVIIICAIPACAPQQVRTVRVLDKPGMTAAEERVDWGLCGGRYDAHGTGIIRSGEDISQIEKCMKKKGYTVKRKFIQVNALGFGASDKTAGETQTDWGLCGGQFDPNGRWIKPINFDAARRCMVEEKGYIYSP